MKPSTVIKITEQDLKKMITDYLSKTNQEVGQVSLEVKTECVGYYETMETKLVAKVTKNSSIKGYKTETTDSYEESDIKEIIKYMLQDSEYEINNISISKQAASNDGPFSSSARFDNISVFCKKKVVEKVMK